MDRHFWTALLASLLAAGVTTLGLYTIRRFEEWGRRHAALFGSFAAGVLVAVSFLHILPKSYELSVHAPAFCLIGYVLMHISNRFVTTQVCDRPETARYAIGLTPMIGIGLHSFIDGALYSIAFKVGVVTGVLAATGMVLHEFPEGIFTYLLLLRGGFSEKRALVLAFVATALTTPLGMLLSFPFIDWIGDEFLGAMLSLSAGALVYVGATHLLPHAERETPKHSIFALLGGILTALGIVLSK